MARDGIEIVADVKLWRCMPFIRTSKDLVLSWVEFYNLDVRRKPPIFAQLFSVHWS